MILNSSPPIVKLYHIDQCITSHALETQLVEIPSEITSLRPLMFKLRIINLIPLDGDKNYSKEDTDKLKSEINSIREKLVFTCRVQMAFNDLLFADNFEAKNSRGAVKFRLQQTHLKLGLSEINHEVGNKIRKLAKNETDVLENHSKLDLEIKRIPSKEQKTVTEMWKELKCGESYSVTFSHYISPYSFFVVVDSSENFVLKKWMKKFEAFDDMKALESFNTGSPCLLTKNRINKRAKILSNNENEVQLLLVDFGEIVNEIKSLIFELPDEFKEFRYQAVHCSLKGIKPKFNMKFWPKMQKTVIYDLINDRDWNLKVFGKSTRQHEFDGMLNNSYEVFLYDDNNEYLHEIAIQSSFACQDGSFEIITTQESSDEDTTESCEENSSESYDTMNVESESDDNDKTKSESDSGFRSSESEQNAEELPSFNLEGLKTLMEIYQKSIDAEYKSCEVKAPVKVSESNEDMKPSLLTNLFKHPHIEWRQNEIFLYLIINAKDCTDYSITLGECTADIAIVYDDKIERALLQLYGLIAPKLCSHNCNGGDVILRLAKRAINREWPRLTQEKSNSAYVKFSDEKVPFIPIESVSKTSNIATGRPAGLSDDDDDDDESNSDSKCFSSDED